MGRVSVRRIVLAVVGALGVAVGLLGVSTAINRGPGLAGTLAGSPYGWIVPPGALIVILGVVYLLVSQRAGRTRGEGFTDCPGCGEQVVADWRLCPYCGRALDRADAGAPNS